jgi:hypothetical protein
VLNLLELCAFDAPRVWTAADQALTAWLQSPEPLAAAYVAAHAQK